MKEELKYRLLHKTFVDGKYVYSEGASGVFHSNRRGGIYNYIFNNYTDIRSEYFKNPNSKRFLKNDVLEIYSCEGNYFGYFMFDGNKFIYFNNLIKEIEIKDSEIDVLNLELEKLKIDLKSYHDKYRDEHKLRLNIERKNTILKDGVEVLFLYPSGDTVTCVLAKDISSETSLSVIEKYNNKFVCNLNTDWYINQPIFLNFDDLNMNKDSWKKELVKCSACNGKGTIGINFCFNCDKEGFVWT
jgi:hypothetical protein